MEIDALIVDNAPTLDKKALVGIYERHNMPLFRYAYRLLGDRDLAEDCVSETFSRFLQAAQNGGSPILNIRAYLYRMAHNWATDHYRRRLNSEVPLEVELSSGPEHNPAHQFARDQQREKVRGALFSLPADQRLDVELRFLEEWSHEAVAEAMGKTTEATRAMQHRALLSLRRILLEEFTAMDELIDRSETDGGSSNNRPPAAG